MTLGFSIHQPLELEIFYRCRGGGGEETGRKEGVARRNVP